MRRVKRFKFRCSLCRDTGLEVAPGEVYGVKVCTKCEGICQLKLTVMERMKEQLMNLRCEIEQRSGRLVSDKPTNTGRRDDGQSKSSPEVRSTEQIQTRNE
jgi:hypothetical protein